MLKQPKISVILPFFNAEKSLDRAISSIFHQTFENFECILVDNNSTDKSYTIASEWAKKDTRFVLVKEKKQGIVHACNTAISKAKGKYIARMDADDWSFPGRFMVQSKFLDQNNDYGAVSGLVKHEGHQEGGFFRYVRLINEIQNYTSIFKRRFVESPLVHPSMMWKKELNSIYGNYLEGDFPEDYELWLRWLHEGVKIGKVPFYILKWFDSPGRLTRIDKRYNDTAFYKLKSYYLSKWLKNHNPFHPFVMVWGASRTSRQRAKLIEDQGLVITHYIDTRHDRQLEKNIIYYKDIPPPKETFILVYMKHIEVKSKIIQFLLEKDFVEGKNFLLLS
ncbi:MAG: glycosyltransferase family 2 protein [Bacteroidota bacterium]